MTPRQRVMTSLDHRQPDRVPLDLISTEEVLSAVEQYLGLEPEPDPRFPWYLAAHEKLLEALHIDLRFVEPPYIGPPLPRFDEYFRHPCAGPAPASPSASNDGKENTR